MIETEDYTPPTGDANEPPVYALSGLISALVADADARHEARETGKPLGVGSGFAVLDAALGGSLSPGLHCLHAEPGLGKTAFALQLAARCGFPCLFVTCEVSPLELLRRHTARVTDTFLGRFKDGTLPARDVERLAARAAATAPNLAIMDATAKAASLASLTREAEKHLGESPHSLLVIDSLHAWARRAAPPGLTEYDALNAALGGLGELAARLSCPLLYVAERNRGSMKGGGQSAGAGTRVIEYGAETVLELSRDDKAEPDADGWADVSLTLSKNRHGATGAKIPMRWRGSTQTFAADFGGER